MHDLISANVDSCLDGEVPRFKPFPLPGSYPHYAPDRSYQTEHIKLELSFDIPKRRLFGVASLRLKALNPGLRAIALDAVEMEIRDASVDGIKAGFEYSGRTVSVHLPKELGEGEKTTVAVKYEASPRKGLYFILPDEAYPKKPTQIWTQGEDEDSRYWFPCYDSPNDKSSSELIATVPGSFTVIANGRLIDAKQNEDGTKTFHYGEATPHSSYLNSLVAGEYVKLEDKFDGVALEYYVPAGKEEDARRSFGKTPDMMKFFSENIGIKYPYSKYAQSVVTDFTFGGMENITATTLTEFTLHDARAHLDYSSDDLVSHELAHQWFGDLLTCRDWSHGWLNEGFATYFEELYKEHDKGHDEFVYSMMQESDRYREEDSERYRRPIVEKIYESPSEVFDRHLYEKGGCVLHMIRFALGDALFWKSMSHYANTNQRRNVETDDLRKAIEEATGRNLEVFFNQWLYKAGHPEFKVEYQWREDSKTAQLDVSQTQATTDNTPLFQLPVEIKFTTSEGVKSFIVEVKEKKHTFYFPLTEKPKTVEFDPGNWILKTLDFEKPLDLLLNQLSSENLVERIRGVQGLSKIATIEAAAAIGSVLLNDSFWGVQAEAAKSLGNLRTDAALDHLLKGLSVKHPKARRAVVRALGEFKNERAAEALIPILKHDESYFVEAEAATSLGKTKSTKAFEALREALQKESFNEAVRIGVFQGLNELKDERAIPLALEWSNYGKPVQARAAAIGTLGKLAERKKDEAFDTLVSLLADREFRVRLAVIQALEDLKEMKAVAELERQSDRELDGRVKRRAKEAIKTLQEGLERSKEFQQLREDVDKLREDNRSLRSKLNEIEAKLRTSKG